VFGLIPVKKVFVDEDFLKDGSDSLLNKTIVAALRQKPVAVILVAISRLRYCRETIVVTVKRPKLIARSGRQE
jgi:hypothetical protein